MRLRPDRGPYGRAFAWSRRTTEGGRSYRLFRRDLSGALHLESLHVPIDEAPSIAARALRVVRRNLRNRVDEIDLQMMEQTA